MLRRSLWAALVLGAAGPAWAQDLPDQSRPLLGAAIRDVLIETHSLLAPLREPIPLTAADLYGDESARDLNLLKRAAPRLFAPDLPGFGPKGGTAALAFFTQADCADCASAEAELRALSDRLGLRVNTFDMANDMAFATELGLDMAPSYVLPDMLLRGAMPAIVLEKYLSP